MDSTRMTSAASRTAGRAAMTKCADCTDAAGAHHQQASGGAAAGSRRRSFGGGCCRSLLALAAIAAPLAGSASEPSSTTLGLVLTGIQLALYETPNGKQECPEGFNSSQRANYLAQFRDEDAREAQQARYGYGYGNRGPNGENVFYTPTIVEDPLPFREIQGSTALGVNLDGKVGPNDFTSPSGEKGIDNQLYRAVGCIEGLRSTGLIHSIVNQSVRIMPYNRYLIEIDGIVGRDPIYVDATDAPIPGGTERIDYRLGGRYMTETHGRIENGVLITQPVDADLPFAYAALGSADIWMRGLTLRIPLKAGGSEGMLAGYADVASWWLWLTKSWGAGPVADSTHWSPSSLYKALTTLADGYADARTGRNTAISAAYTAQFVPVFIVHDDAVEKPPRTASSAIGH
jgi:hypothetical protein